MIPSNFQSTQTKTLRNIMFHFNKGINLSHHLHSLLISENREDRKMATQIIIDLDLVHQKLEKNRNLNSSIILPSVNQLRSELFNKLIKEHPQILDRKPCDLIVPNIKDIESWLAPVLIMSCYDDESKSKCHQLISNFFHLLGV